MTDKKFNRTLVTTALPYANGPIHLGHFAGTFLPADIYVRYKRLRGEDIIHIGGSDEHGVPITIRAEKEGITPQQVVDRFHNLQKDALAKANISIDNFSRTSLPVHHATAQEFFLDMEQKGIFVKKTEKQFYDEDAKMFLSDRYVTGTCPVCGNTDANGDQCENCGTYLSATELINPKSKITSKTPVLRETLHWYFPLGKYQKQLEAFINQHEGDWRQNVINYSRTWLNSGLTDRAITRDLSWGVNVPLTSDDAKGKVLYVWFDAVLGYISSTKEWAAKHGKPDEWKKYWLQPDTRLIHFIGKDNVVFHTLMFPAMLMAKNEGSAEQYILPDNVPASEFMNIEGKKFSKSRGYAIYLSDFLEKFPADTLRYMIAMNYPENRDTDFSWKEFQSRTNSELADTLGNFVKRVIDFTNARMGGVVPEVAENQLSENDTHLKSQILTQVGATDTEAQVKPTFTITEYYEQFSIRSAVFETMQIAGLANKYFNDETPWKSIKENPEKCKRTIFVSLNVCYSLAIIFYPILPDTSKKIFRMLGIEGDIDEKIKQGEIKWDVRTFQLHAGHKLSGTSEILFKKIEDADIEPELKKIDQMVSDAQTAEQAKTESAKSEAAPPAHEAAAAKPVITIEDFEKIDLRVGTVMACEKVPKADKLLKLQVRIGADERQILSGIAMHFTPEEMVGKNILVVANLAPRKMRGLDSNGMLLAVEGSDGKLNLVQPQGEGINGNAVK
jgi:methionyl-tRNA synthetase